MYLFFALWSQCCVSIYTWLWIDSNVNVFLQSRSLSMYQAILSNGEICVSKLSTIDELSTVHHMTESFIFPL